MNTMETLGGRTNQGVYSEGGGDSPEHDLSLVAVSGEGIAFGGLRKIFEQYGNPPGGNGNLEL